MYLLIIKLQSSKYSSCVDIYVPAQPRIIHIREYAGPFANGPAQPRIFSFANGPAQPRIAAQYEGYSYNIL
jgi:hypothetical protein